MRGGCVPPLGFLEHVCWIDQRGSGCVKKQHVRGARLLLVIMSELVDEDRGVRPVENCECLCDLWMPACNKPGDRSSPVVAQDVHL
eukprot:COSAG02_NODE_4342_length_5477_cov_3.682968_6_plen_86_part_00